MLPTFHHTRHEVEMLLQVILFACKLCHINYRFALSLSGDRVQISDALFHASPLIVEL